MRLVHRFLRVLDHEDVLHDVLHVHREVTRGVVQLDAVHVFDLCRNRCFHRERDFVGSVGVIRDEEEVVATDLAELAPWVGEHLLITIEVLGQHQNATHGESFDRAGVDLIRFGIATAGERTNKALVPIRDRRITVEVGVVHLNGQRASDRHIIGELVRLDGLRARDVGAAVGAGVPCGIVAEPTGVERRVVRQQVPSDRAVIALLEVVHFQDGTTRLEGNDDAVVIQLVARIGHHEVVRDEHRALIATTAGGVDLHLHTVRRSVQVVDGVVVDPVERIPVARGQLGSVTVDPQVLELERRVVPAVELVGDVGIRGVATRIAGITRIVTAVTGLGVSVPRIAGFCGVTRVGILGAGVAPGVSRLRATAFRCVAGGIELLPTSAAGEEEEEDREEGLDAVAHDVPRTQ